MNLFTGFLIGVASLIPGISSGTILVLINKYEYITNLIVNFKNQKNFFILTTIILGIFLGAITFSRIIELLFYFLPTETLTFFSGLVLFQVPHLIKTEEIKFQKSAFLFGLIFLLIIGLIPHDTDKVITSFPPLTFSFLILFMGSGLLDGFFTIIPGISGSLMMMILGPYFLYKSYLANLNFQTLSYLIPLLFYFIGDLFGFFLGSIVSKYFLKKKKRSFLNFIMGMIIGSILIILPLPNNNTLSLLKYLLSLVFSYLTIYLLNKIKRSS